MDSKTINSTLQEGRGVYTLHGSLNDPFTIYTKGSGIENYEEDPVSIFGFGTDDWFYEWQREFGHPRIWGAAYLDEIRAEFANSLYIFINNVHASGAKTKQDLLDKGLCFPLSVVNFQGASHALQERISEYPTGTKRSDIQIGSVSLVVPSYTRANKGQDLEGVQNIANTIIRLWQYSGAIVFPSSAHPQNFYRTPTHPYGGPHRKHAVDNAFDRRNFFTAHADNEDILIRSALPEFQGHWPSTIAISLEELYDQIKGKYELEHQEKKAEFVFTQLREQLSLPSNASYKTIADSLYARVQDPIITFEELRQLTPYSTEQLNQDPENKIIEKMILIAKNKGLE